MIRWRGEGIADKGAPELKRLVSKARQDLASGAVGLFFLKS